MADFEYPIACLRGVWSFILGSLRLILFTATIIYLIVHLAIAASAIFWAKPLLSDDLQGEAGFFDYVLALMLVGVAVLGFYGSFYKHITSIRVFAILTSLLGIYFLICAAAKNPESHQELDEVFNKSMELYNWKAAPNPNYNQEASAANKHVDGLQFLGCCGYRSYKDWNVYRPSDADPNQLPISCCGSFAPMISPKSCSSDDFEPHRRPGCQKLIAMTVEGALYLSVFYGFYQMFMGLIAFIVSYCNLADFVQQQQGQQASDDTAYLTGQQHNFACNNIIIESGGPRRSQDNGGYIPASTISTISSSEIKMPLVQSSNDLMGMDRPSAPSPPPKYPNLL